MAKHLDMVSGHHKRLRALVLRREGMSDLARWVTENTNIGFSPYSFKDHEYQETILADTSRQVAVRKCSQVGVSEASARLALAMVCVVKPLTVIYTLPTAKFSGTFMRTRIDPVIQGSDALKAAIHRTNDNSDLKQFGDSFLYVRGAASANAPISIPADVLIHDEMDFCDQEVLSQYTSRLTHSPWKLYRRFSTPTVPGFGIDKVFQESRRHFNMCKCHHCGHFFVPDYYEHVRIPGFLGDLRGMTKQIMARTRWQEAAVHCPNCGLVPSLQIEHRQYVCENPDSGLVGAGYQVSPFDAPNVVSVPDLVDASTNYSREQDFVNFNLGMPMEDTDASLQRGEIEALFEGHPPEGGRHVMGIDVGHTYHFTVARVRYDSTMTFVHAEQVPMGQARAKFHELRQRYRVQRSVIDSAPHAETVMTLQAEDPTLYASVYVRNKGLTTHVVVTRDSDESEGRAFVRQVNVNRSRAFDAYMLAVRTRGISFSGVSDEVRATLIQHHVSMKRVKVPDGDSDQMVSVWQKSDGNDHFHHACLYARVAGEMLDLGGGAMGLPATLGKMAWSK